MLNKVQSYEMLSGQTARQITASREQWTDFLRLSGRLYKYPFAEQLLIYAQRPGAEACAEYDVWNTKMQRYVRRGSKGIALIDNTTSQPRLKYVFDVADTGGKRKPYLWQYDEDKHQDVVIMALEQEYGVPGEKGLAEQLKNIAEGMAAEYWEQNRQDILDVVWGSSLSQLPAEDIGEAYVAAAGVSIAYTLLSRCDLNPNIYFEHEEFLSIFDFNTPNIIAALGAAVSDCSERALRQIEITIKNYVGKGAGKMDELTYRQAGDYLLPELSIFRQELKTLGKYGLLRRKYLREQRPVIWNGLTVSGQLNRHLLEIERTANNRPEQLIKELAVKAGVTEELKERNPLKWAGLMNSLHHQAEEIILREIVYS